MIILRIINGIISVDKNDTEEEIVLKDYDFIGDSSDILRDECGEYLRVEL
jgi:hypothetical protein